MIKEIKEEDWEDIFINKEVGISFNPIYLNAINDAFKCTIRYFIIERKDTVCLAVALFTKKNKVVLPDNFTYTPLWVSPFSSERKQLELLTDLAVFLKNNFKKVVLKLDINFADCRAFKWQNYLADTRYTYIRKQKTVPLNIIKRKLNKNKNEKVEVVFDDPNENDIFINLKFLKNLGFSNKKNKNYKNLFLDWSKSGFLKSFRAIENQKTLSTYLVLVDQKHKKAYTLAINAAERNSDYIHALIYTEICNWADENNYHEVDFCGANMNGISQFKSYFNPELTPYFIVKYSYWQNKFRFFKFIFDRI